MQIFGEILIHFSSEWLIFVVFIHFTFLFTFTHLADAFIQSDLQCIQAIYFYIGTVCSLGIEPTTFLHSSTTEPQEHWNIYTFILASLFST